MLTIDEIKKFLNQDEASEIKKAAIRAGYSEKTAQEQSSRLLSNVMVQEYMQKKMQQREDDLIADQNEVLRYLTAVMARVM